ncbi:MAG: hypothetical protein ACI8RZ_000770 [Myxococcota bacterium]|jgi:hypothetical protein
MGSGLMMGVMIPSESVFREINQEIKRKKRARRERLLTLFTLGMFPLYHYLSVKWGHRSRIADPPGLTILRIAKFFYTPATIKGVFLPLVADLQDEYFNAIDQQHSWKARWIRVCYFWDFLDTFGFQKAFDLLKALRKNQDEKKAG